MTECPEARQDKKVQNILNRVHPIIRRNMQRDATKKQTWWKGQGSPDPVRPHRTSAEQTFCES